MFELTPSNTPQYLSARGYPEPVAVTPLGGGVSNTVLLVETRDGRIVLKQSLAKLRVEQDWYSDRERILRESAVMRALVPHLLPGGVPEILFEDRENCAFAMTAAPEGACTWKSQLMKGEVSTATAATVGEMLAEIVRATWRDPVIERQFGDQTVFDQLRLDPYYRSTAARHPDLEPHFTELMRSSAARRFSLVHGDWSPKNFLVSGECVMAIDFEVVHFGDPSFDSAFLLNHLALKCFCLPAYRDRLIEAAAAFWDSLSTGLPPDSEWMEAATLEHLGALMLARVDGKSPVEYLTDPALRDTVRRFARDLILRPPATIAEVFAAV